VKDEDNIRYFKPGTMKVVLFLGILGLLILAVGMEEGFKTFFLAIGGVLVFLAIYQFIWNKLHKMTGAALDKNIEEGKDKINLRKKTLDTLCLDKSDLACLKSLKTEGYCHNGIDTQPLFRRDDDDGRLRSSNYQISIFLFGADRFYTYAYTRSLVDNELAQKGRMWRYSEIVKADVKKENFTYIVGGNDEKHETAEIEYFVVTSSDGESYIFEINNDTDAPAKISQIRRTITAHGGKVGGALPDPQEGPEIGDGEDVFD
jgi:hypothetical protein